MLHILYTLLWIEHRVLSKLITVSVQIFSLVLPLFLFPFVCLSPRVDVLEPHDVGDRAAVSEEEELRDPPVGDGGEEGGQEVLGYHKPN